eukprot:1952477-Rhodomonas_salina.3
MGWVLAGLGSAYEEAGRYGEAGRWFREAIEHANGVLEQRKHQREEEKQLWVGEVLVLRGTVQIKVGELVQSAGYLGGSEAYSGTDLACAGTRRGRGRTLQRRRRW